MYRFAVVASLLTCLAVSSTPAAEADSLLLCGFEEVFAVSPETLKSGNVEKLWSWRARDQKNLPEGMVRFFGTTDDTKPIHGGSQILITSSGGGCALVDYPSGKVSWYAFVENAHSIELLPGDRVIVAGSTARAGNRLELFDLSRSEESVWSTPLHSAHGVVWDDARDSLWALGYDELRCYRLTDWDSKTPSLTLERTHALPNEGGHELQPVPGSNDLIISTHDSVFLFDRETEEFRPHPELRDRKHVKGVAVHPRTGKTFFVQGDAPEWWSVSVQSTTEPKTLPVEGERLYKVRWLLNENP